MERLIDENGSVGYGFYDKAIDCNYKDYRLSTVMTVAEMLKPFRVSQFIFLEISGTEVAAGIAVADHKYFANASVYLFDKKNRELADIKKITLPSNVFISRYPDELSCIFDTEALHIEMEDGKVSGKSEIFSFDAELDIKNAPLLRLCTRSGYRGWTYTQKSAPIRLSGKIRCKEKDFSISSPSCLAITDWTTGYMRRDTFWNRASAACSLPGGRTFGLNLSWGINETGFTENAFWLDKEMTKVDMVSFVSDSDDPGSKWHITSYDGKIDLTFQPDCHINEKINVLIIASKLTRFVGTFEGRLITDKGETADIRACPGWMADGWNR